MYYYTNSYTNNITDNVYNNLSYKLLLHNI